MNVYLKFIRVSGALHVPHLEPTLLPTTDLVGGECAMVVVSLPLKHTHLIGNVYFVREASHGNVLYIPVTCSPDTAQFHLVRMNSALMAQHHGFLD